MTEVIKTIKACHVKDGMRIRYDRGAYTVEGDVKCVEDYIGSLVAVTFERNGNEASNLIDRSADVDVLRKPVPKEPKNLGAVVKYTDSWGKIAYLVRAKRDYAPGCPWLHAEANYDLPWAEVTGSAGDCTIEVLFEGVNIDD